LETVNIADCVDLYCDGLKKAKIQDFDGGVFDVAGTLMAEGELGRHLLGCAQAT